MEGLVRKYRNGFWFTCLTLVLLLFAAWHFAIKKTTDLMVQNKELTTSIAQAENAPLRIQQLRQQTSAFNAKYGNHANQQEDLLKEISTWVSQHNLRLASFEQVKVERENGFENSLLPFEVEGSFSDILKLIYYIEQDAKLGRISHTTYQTHEDRRTKRKSLRATIYLHQVKAVKS